MSGSVFAPSGPWLFSRRLDLCAFAGSTALSIALVALGAALGLLERDVPEWTWLGCIVAVDVAHVWSSGFRVYFDRRELASRPLLYVGLPLLAYGAGVALYAASALTFWRALAYVAVFHFVRQQVGFMALYGRRQREPSALDRTLDRTAVYAATLYPIAYWHAHDRGFAWFVEGDFVAIDALGAALPALELLSFGVLAAFLLRQVRLALTARAVPGKTILLLSTFCCWYGGIVVFDSDYVFTVTNVLLHGVPYLLLTFRYARAREASLGAKLAALGFIPCCAVCVAFALAEEALWDRWVWHERPYLFGNSEVLAAPVLVFVIPLLAVPQLTHYLLDGFVWRVRSENPVLRRELEAA